MIIKGGARSDGGQLAAYLLGQKHDEAEVLLIRGTTATDLQGALLEMDERTELTRTRSGLYHAEINWRIYEPLSLEDQLLAVRVLEDRLGFTGQPFAVVRHVYEGREHLHVVWSLVDMERERAIRYSHNYRKHEEASRELEWLFGHERVQGAHVERDGVDRPLRTPEQYEYQQAERFGRPDPRAFRETVRNAYAQSDNGSSLKAALADEHCILANGDRRDCFVVVNEHGGVLALKTSTVSARAADIRAKLKDLDRSQLPSVEEAKAQQRDRLRTRAEQQDRSGEQGARDAAAVAAKYAPLRETERTPLPVFDRDAHDRAWQEGVVAAAIADSYAKEQDQAWREFTAPVTRQEPPPERAPVIAPEIGKTAGEIRLARTLSDRPQDFADALEDRGLHLARVAAADLEQFKSPALDVAPARAPWMGQTGGVDALSVEQRASAERSYAHWQHRERHDLADYVGYVQKKWVDEQRAPAQPRSAKTPQEGELVVVNASGTVHRLSERNTGLDRAALDAYLADIDRAPLLTVSEAQAVATDVRGHAREEWRQARAAERAARQAERRAEYVEERNAAIAGNETVQTISAAYASTVTGPEFVNELERQGLTFLRVSDHEAERSQTQHDYLHRTPVYEPGAYLVLNERGHAFRLDGTTIHDDEHAIRSRLAQIDAGQQLTLSQALDYVTYQRGGTEPTRSSTLLPEVRQRAGGLMRGGSDIAGIGLTMTGSAARVAASFLNDIGGGLADFFTGGSGKTQRLTTSPPPARDAAPPQSADRARTPEQRAHEPSASTPESDALRATLQRLRDQTSRGVDVDIVRRKDKDREPGRDR